MGAWGHLGAFLYSYVKDLRVCGHWCSQGPGADPPGHQGAMEVKFLGSEEQLAGLQLCRYQCPLPYIAQG